VFLQEHKEEMRAQVCLCALMNNLIWGKNLHRSSFCFMCDQRWRTDQWTSIRSSSLLWIQSKHLRKSPIYFKPPGFKQPTQICRVVLTQIWVKYGQTQLLTQNQTVGLKQPCIFF